jgi:hypothetical protein
MLAQQRKDLGIVPGRMAHLHGKRVIAEAFQNRAKIRGRFRGPVKRKRELQQHRAELPGLVQDIEAGAYRAFILGGGTRVVREFLPQLGSEHKARIRGNAFEPLLGVLRVQWLVEGSVDLDGVKELREVRSFVKAFRSRRRVHVSSPI